VADHAVLFRGRLMKVPFEVRGPTDHGMRFRGRFRAQTWQITNHTTGAENSPHQMFNNLSSAEPPLSVHFAVDPEARVYQFADTELRCSHVGTSANDWTIGIEFICRFDALDDVPHKGVVRARVTDFIHGQACVYDALTPKQLAIGVKLNEALCDLYDLPMQVPLAPSGDVWATTMSAAQLKRFRGCTPHFLYKPTKRDPGLRLLRAIHERGQERPGSGVA
jgi:hypothetical protein